MSQPTNFLILTAGLLEDVRSQGVDEHDGKQRAARGPTHSYLMKGLGAKRPSPGGPRTAKTRCYDGRHAYNADGRLSALENQGDLCQIRGLCSACAITIGLCGG